MMDINELRQRIEQIMGIRILEHEMAEEEWESKYATGHAQGLMKKSSFIIERTETMDHSDLSGETASDFFIPIWQGNSKVIVWEPLLAGIREQTGTSNTDENGAINGADVEGSDLEGSPALFENDEWIAGQNSATAPLIMDHSNTAAPDGDQSNLSHTDAKKSIVSKNPTSADSSNILTSVTVGNERIGREELYRLYQLLELLLPSVTGMQPVAMTVPVRGPEQEARELGQWLVKQLALRAMATDIPEEFTIRRRLNRVMVPFVLVADSLPAGTLHPKQLGKLLTSYFDRNVLLIPLQENEWLILANYGLIEDEEKQSQQQPTTIDSSRQGSSDDKGTRAHARVSEDRRARSSSSEDKANRSSGSSTGSKEGRESIRDVREASSESEDTEEDLLTAFALGLHELVASEWVGSFHISVGLPLHPLHGLIQMVSHLRETIHLGQLFHVTEHIHLPWELRLESLLYRIPEEERLRFVESAHRYSQLFDDDETVATLETFFKMDCNVSETAKQLYIHRNTLLYRLDRIKQDTQLDVRRFEDAVLMRLTLLLYKVTKS